jgi:hypothetical protein
MMTLIVGEYESSMMIMTHKDKNNLIIEEEPMCNRLLTFLGYLVISFMMAQTVQAQIPELCGVSDFLCGVWKSKITKQVNNKDSRGEMTYIVLHNPTGVTRDAVILYYDEDQKFVNCQVVRLTPHDFEKLPLIFPKGPYDGSKKGTIIQGQGVVEIRSAPVGKEDPNNPGGLTGYVQIVEGHSMYDFGAWTPPDTWNVSGNTLGFAPLFPVDTKLFTPHSPIQGQYTAIYRCVCEKLAVLNSPQSLKKIFCIQIK